MAVFPLPIEFNIMRKDLGSIQYFRFRRVTKTQETSCVGQHKSGLGLLFIKHFSDFLPFEKPRDKQDNLAAKGTEGTAKSKIEQAGLWGTKNH